jgi:hypothetical protein
VKISAATAMTGSQSDSQPGLRDASKEVTRLGRRA